MPGLNRRRKVNRQSALIQNSQPNEVPPPRPPRGVSLGIRVLSRPEDREIARLGEERFLDNGPRTKAGVLMKAHINKAWPTWTKFDEEAIHNALTEFKRYYRFPEGKEVHGRNVFLEHCKKNYSDWMCKARERAMAKAKTDIINIDCKEYPPKWLASNVWSELVDYWMTEEFKKQQETNSKNRSGLTILHTGGSAPFEAHYDAIFRKEGHEPNLPRFWGMMHRKDRGNGEWLNPRAQEIAEEYTQLLGASTQPRNGDDSHDNPDDVPPDGSQNETPNDTTETPPDNYQLWAEVTNSLSKRGGLSRNRIIGIGKRKKAKYLLGNSSTSDSSNVQSETFGLTTIEDLDKRADEKVEHELAARMPHLDPSRYVDKETAQKMIDDAHEKQRRFYERQNGFNDYVSAWFSSQRKESSNSETNATNGSERSVDDIASGQFNG